MAEIVNLRVVRKAQNRANAEKAAAENRTRFGRTKAERVAQDREADRIAKTLDGAKRSD
ncbi:DUF4169 domain-containing protein [Sphingobium sp. SCG-1]|uniref:DUF4169 family protein n=1 Tax=Sphingobium sp. SCG-1 TaxID=2072936 RepID=UPI000CD696FC|nr:DUF4169 family protein [Sphingobium sp. SCG-1]AUW56726.1 DUF4169 domain-containing protein [Sphingobium sp. SCG-1]